MSINFNELPHEIMVMIFAYFSPKELCRNLVPVCKQWRRFAYDPLLWKKIKFDGRRDSMSSAKELLNRCVLITEFSLTEVGNWADFVSYLVNCRYLQKITFSGCHGITETSALQLVDYCPLVEDLKVFYCGYFNPDVTNAMMRWKRLKNVSFSCLRYRLSEEFRDNETVTIIANKCENIENVELDLNKMGDDSLQVLLNLKGPQITKLLVNLSSVTVKSTNLLRRCSLLTELSLIYVENMMDIHFLVIKDLQCLRSLKIKYAPFLTSVGMAEAFRQATFPRLETLALIRCVQLDDAAIAVISQYCPHLKCLDIWAMRNITDVGLASVAYHCKNLKSLYIGVMDNVTKNAFEDIATAFPALVKLSVVWCENFTVPIIRKITENNPHVHVYSNV